MRRWVIRPAAKFSPDSPRGRVGRRPRQRAPRQPARRVPAPQGAQGRRAGARPERRNPSHLRGWIRTGSAPSAPSSRSSGAGVTAYKEAVEREEGDGMRHSTSTAVRRRSRGRAVEQAFTYSPTTSGTSSRPSTTSSRSSIAETGVREPGRRPGLRPRRQRLRVPLGADLRL